MALVALFSMLVSASAQQICAPEAEIIRALQERADEFVQWRGVVNADVTLILTTSRGGGWTLLAVQDGIACVVAIGHAHELAHGA
jgi:hypothetical protein